MSWFEQDWSTSCLPSHNFQYPRKDSNFHCPRSKRGDSCQLVYVGVVLKQALSTRFELAIFSVTGRRELQASPREHSVGDDRIELPSSRCKRDVIPFHQSPAAVQGFEPRLTRSERVVRPAHSTATTNRIEDRGVDPRLAASKAAVQGRYTNPQCAMRELNSHHLVGGQKSCR